MKNIVLIIVSLINIINIIIIIININNYIKIKKIDIKNKKLINNLKQPKKPESSPIRIIKENGDKLNEKN